MPDNPPDNTKESGDMLGILQSFSPDDSTADNVEELWRKVMIYKSLENGGLTQARTKRVQAEAAREEAEKAAVRATSELCDRMRAEAEKNLQEAERVKAEVNQVLQEAKVELSQANEIKAQTERQRQQLIADAEDRKQEILDQATASAQLEITQLRREALKEIKVTLTTIEEMREAIEEELETQRILTDAAKLNAIARRPDAETGKAETEAPEAVTSADVAQMNLEGGPDGTEPESDNPRPRKWGRGQKRPAEV